MQQQFYFPEEVGVVQKVKEFSVVPIWEKVPRKESFRLTGIYRITATIIFEKGLCACEGVLIDDLDVNDDAHYFEYGSPLEVDLPLRAYELIQLQVKDKSASIQPDGTLIISFKVECNLTVNEPQDQPKIEQPVREQKQKEVKHQPQFESKETLKNEYPVEEKENVQLFVQEIDQPVQHEFSFLHQLKEEYSLFSFSQIKSDNNK